MGAWPITNYRAKKLVRFTEFSVTAIDAGTSGRLVALGCGDGSIRIWNPVANDCILISSGHGNFVTAVRLRSDQRQIVSGDSTGALRVWDRERKTMVLEGLAHENRISTLDLTSNGGYIVSGSIDGLLCVWTGSKPNRSLSVQSGQGCIRSIRVNERHNIFLSLGSEGCIKVWSMKSSSLLGVIAHRSRNITTFDFVAGLSGVVCGLDDGEISVWRLPDVKLVYSMPGHNLQIDQLVTVDDGLKMVSYDASGLMNIWCCDFVRRLVSMYRERDSIGSATLYPVFDRGESRMVIGAGDRAYQVWDLDRAHLAKEIQAHSTGDISVLGLSGDGRFVVSGTNHGELCVFDLISCEERSLVCSHSGCVCQLQLCDDDRLAVSGDSTGQLKVWDVTSGREHHTLAAHASSVMILRVSGDGSRAVSGGWDGQLKIWNLCNGECVFVLPDDNCRARTSFFELDKRFEVAVSASDDGDVIQWCVNSGQLVRVLGRHRGGVSCLRLSRNGEVVISAGLDGIVNVWELCSGTLICRLNAHRGGGGVTALALEPTGMRALSGGWDGVVRLWDLNSARLLWSIQAHHNDIVSVLGCNGEVDRAYSAGGDAALRLWDLETGDEVCGFVADSPILHATLRNVRAVVVDASKCVHILKLGSAWGESGRQMSVVSEGLESTG